MTKWCNNCEEYRESYTDRGDYSEYKPHNRCSKCWEWTLANSDDKNLYRWWNNGIDTEQKDAIVKFGVDATIYSKKKYRKGDLLKLYYWFEIFKSNEKTNKLDIKGKILQINFFSSWWNNNLILILADNNQYKEYHRFYLVVYEMPMQSGGNYSLGALESFCLFDGTSSYPLSHINDLQKKLQSDNPINSYENNYMGTIISIDIETNHSSEKFPMTFWLSQPNHELVKRYDLTNTDAWSNPNKHIKPQDISSAIHSSLI